MTKKIIFSTLIIIKHANVIKSFFHKCHRLSFISLIGQKWYCPPNYSVIFLFLKRFRHRFVTVPSQSVQNWSRRSSSITNGFGQNGRWASWTVWGGTATKAFQKWKNHCIFQSKNYKRILRVSLLFDLLFI